MAAVAALRRLDVLEGLGQRAALVVLHVAAGAFPRRALEDRLDVARFATHQLVRSAERKFRRDVVECLRRGLRGDRTRHGGEQDEQDTCDAAAQTSQRRQDQAMQRRRRAAHHETKRVAAGTRIATGTPVAVTGRFALIGRPGRGRIVRNDDVTWHCWHCRP